MITRHIALMYDEAARLARCLDSQHPTLQQVESTMERIDNLVRHAHEELRDEYLRQKFNWPVI